MLSQVEGHQFAAWQMTGLVSEHFKSGLHGAGAGAEDAVMTSSMCGCGAEDDLKNMQMDIHEVDGGTVVSFSVLQIGDSSTSDADQDSNETNSDSNSRHSHPFGSPLDKLLQRVGDSQSEAGSSQGSDPGASTPFGLPDGSGIVFDGSIEPVYVMSDEDEEELHKMERIKATLVQIDRNR